MRGRAAIPWILLGLVLLGLAFLVGAPTGRSDRPLDPRANGPRGAKAVVVLLRELGADVVIERGAPDDDATTAVVLRDRFDEVDDARDLGDVRRWVDAGGVLVVADPSSPLARLGRRAGTTPQPCPVALDGVDLIGPVRGTAAQGRGDDCFDEAVRATSLGAGTVITIADADPFANDFLGDHDNAVLAAALLAPTGTERVAFIQGPAGSGQVALFDLLGSRVAQALGQLAIAFGVYVLWRGRRLGRPVAEPQLVAVAGSELVTAIGRMFGARKQPTEAAARVRADVRRALEHRLGLPADGPVERLADAVASRTGLDPTAVAGALAHRPITTDADLVVVVGDLDRIRDLTLGSANLPGGNP